MYIHISKCVDNGGHTKLRRKLSNADVFHFNQIFGNARNEPFFFFHETCKNKAEDINLILTSEYLILCRKF